MSSVVISCVHPEWILYIIYSKLQRKVANLICVQSAIKINTHLKGKLQDTEERKEEKRTEGQGFGRDVSTPAVSDEIKQLQDMIGRTAYWAFV